MICSAGVYTCLSPAIASGQNLLSLAIGSAFALSAALAWGYYSFYIKSNKIDSSEHQSGLFAGPCSIFCLVLHLLTESTVVPSLSQVAAILYLGLVIMNFSLILWNRAITHGNFKRISLFPYLTPILSIFSLVALGKVEYSNYLVISALLVSFGTLFPFLSPKSVESN